MQFVIYAVNKTYCGEVRVFGKRIGVDVSFPKALV